MANFLSRRSVFVFFCLLFKILLDMSYVKFVSQVYSYSGFSLSIEFANYTVSWFSYIFCLRFTPWILFKISDYFIALFLLGVIAPMCSMYGLGGFEFYPLVATIFSFLFFCMFQHGRLLSSMMLVPKLRGLKYGRQLSVAIASLSVCFLLCWYVISGGINYINFDFSKVYEFREDSARVVNIGLLSYFNNWVYSIFSTFLMAYFLFKKNFLMFLIMFLVQTVFFGVSAHKSVLFFPFIIFSIWIYFRKTKALSPLPIAFSLVVIYCLSVYSMKGDIFAGSLFIRRLFYVPAFLTFKYFEFFSINEHILWSNSVLSGVTNYPYDLNPSKLIGDYVGSGASANNGFIATGFAHAGLFGVFIYSFILAYLLKILDVILLNSDIPVWLGLCITLIPLRSALISSDLFTTLLSHGLLVSIFMLILFRKRRSNFPSH